MTQNLNLKRKDSGVNFISFAFLPLFICSPPFPQHYPQRQGTTIPPADAIRGRIEFKDVTFAYPTRPHHDVLKGFNLKVSFFVR